MIPYIWIDFTENVVIHFTLVVTSIRTTTNTGRIKTAANTGRIFFSILVHGTRRIAFRRVTKTNIRSKCLVRVRSFEYDLNELAYFLEPLNQYMVLE